MIPATVSGTVTPEGLWVIRRRNDLWIVSPARPDRDRRLTTGARGFFGAGYAGIVHRGTAFDLYFTAQESGDNNGGRFTVSRWRSDTAAIERLFEFTGSGKTSEMSTRNAAVRPDGLVVAYAETGNIHLRDMTTGTSKLLLEDHSAGCQTSIRDCWGNFAPEWTPDGKYLTFTRIYWEWSNSFTIDPTIPPTEPPTKAPGPRVDASCEIEDSNALSLAATATRKDGTARVITPRSEAPNTIRATGCAWSEAEEVAVTYTTFTKDPKYNLTEVTSETLAVFDGEFHPLVTVVNPLGRVARWLPGNGGILLQEGYYSPDSRTARPRPTFFVVSRTGEVRSVDLDADVVLDIISD